MKLAKYIIIYMVIVSTSCHSTKTPTTGNITNSATNMKSNLIDGNWEANYIVGATKPFDECIQDESLTLISIVKRYRNWLYWL